MSDLNKCLVCRAKLNSYEIAAGKASCAPCWNWKDAREAEEAANQEEDDEFECECDCGGIGCASN